jgi:hypothetical protein
VELGGTAVQQPTTCPFPQPGHSGNHSGVREDSIRLRCVAVSLADCFFLHWLPWKVMGKDTAKRWEQSPSDTASHSRRLEPSDECNPPHPLFFRSILIQSTRHSLLCRLLSNGWPNSIWYMSTKRLFNSVGTQQIIYYYSINLATCFGSLSHHQANSQTMLKVHSVDVHTVGSHMFRNRMTIKGTNDCLVASIIV